MTIARAALLTLALLAACDGSKPLIKRQAQQPGPFPTPDRPVAPIVSPRWSTEDDRDRAGEAADVMKRAGIAPGMTVADIGAGEGYYTIRLSTKVGKTGRVLAEDVIPDTTDQLAARVARQALDNISVQLGTVADPKLPADSFDRVLMIHMYHEIAQPYEFLWRMRPSLKPDGEVIVVDANRQTQFHGTPPALLKCEFAAVGYSLVSLTDMPEAGGYLAAFRPVGPRPQPGAMRACRLPQRS